MPNFETGRVRISVSSQAGKVSAIHVASERPDVAPLLRGRSATAAGKFISLLFAVCRQAQMRAFELALAAARGEECKPQLDPAVQREAMREHLWRCLLDLPPLLGEAPLQQEFVSVAKSVAQGERDALLNLLQSPQVTVLRSKIVFSNQCTINYHQLLARLDAQALLMAWPRLSAEFCRHPTWQGKAVVTGAMARQHDAVNFTDSFLSAHWLARFDELLSWALAQENVGDVGTVSATPMAFNVGRALVETARGLLMHEIVLEGERIVDYLIVAPTEWNFHPNSVLFKHLLGASAADRIALQQRIAQLVATLDPCVPWELAWA